MVFAPVVPAVRGFFLMVAKDRRLEGGHHESTLLDPCWLPSLPVPTATVSGKRVRKVA